MIRSMTGYGRAREVRNGRDITVEVRAVNNRYLDCTLRLPHLYMFAEDALRKCAQRAASRGKIEIFAVVETQGAEHARAALNSDLARQYLAVLRELSDIMGKDITGQLLSRFPEVLSVEKDEAMDLDLITDDLCAVLDSALCAFNKMREAEGKKLFEDISGRLDSIAELVREIELRSPETVREYRERLLRKMQEVLSSTSIDEQRILTEAAIYADKVAVDEETVRIKSHIAQFRALLESDLPQGRRMDFLLQELNREANTIGSKCNNADIARTVIELKAEIEKIREQAQNIE